ncbi:Bacteriophage Mu Gp45 protein [Amantichitinum ursilacus]|uniref:Bacteriophage Mu Gp45 protein n=2 Tax=Amantichitinum ursilacus TaxID=857265 RepID=A0A0N0GNZ3_9NEIS|nr:Bacteriophage Mu Gp45 protein [Amantichitinum ursilacus]
MERLVQRMVGPLARRIGNLVARGGVLLVTSGSKMQSLQVSLLADEPKDNIEHFEPYGYTACPQQGAEALALFMQGERSHGVVIAVADRRYRMKGLKAGEVALYDDQGQSVYLTRAGIVINGAGKPLTVNNTPTVTVNASATIELKTPLLHVGGMIKADGDIIDNAGAGGKSMASTRQVYNAHTHNENNNAGGPTSTPNQGM